MAKEQLNVMSQCTVHQSISSTRPFLLVVELVVVDRVWRCRREEGHEVRFSCVHDSSQSVKQARDVASLSQSKMRRFLTSNFTTELSFPLPNQ